MGFDVERPKPRLCIGVTGHRTTNALFASRKGLLHEKVHELFLQLEAAVTAENGQAPSRPRLHSPLAFGADTLAVDEAIRCGWDVAAPLPFGRDLNIAINANPHTIEDAEALLRGNRPRDPIVAATAERMLRMAERVRLFELADEDVRVTALFRQALANPANVQAQAGWSVLASERAAVAARVMIEQSDILVALWDGVTPGAVGGTRHTMRVALEEGVSVLWIDVRDPTRITILSDREALDHPPSASSNEEIRALVQAVSRGDGGGDEGAIASMHGETWHARSRRRFHAYRRVETIFGGGPGPMWRSLVQRYESPDRIADGSGADLLRGASALQGADQGFVDDLRNGVLARFALADGISTYLSDSYRSGMVLNFILSASAIVIGSAYLPLVSVEWKWPFAAAELLLLLAIVSITSVGRSRGWHRRWFETRRVAEYLRHAPVLLLLGVGRPSGRWPKAAKATWPERYARLALRELGLPQVRVTTEYLRAAIGDLLETYVRSQCDYHREKAVRLARVHHNLDRASGALFILAVLSVAIYLLIVLAGAAGLMSAHAVAATAKPFTFLGVTLPAIGGAFAGIRYFGDFERFSAISEVTAEKLELLDTRIRRTLAGPDESLCYASAASLAHAMDEIVVSEIESWQSVFAAKNIAVPV